MINKTRIEGWIEGIGNKKVFVTINGVVWEVEQMKVKEDN